MKKMIIIFLLVFLMVSCAPVSVPEEDGCVLTEAEELTLHGGAYYFDTDEDVWCGEFGKEPTLYRKNARVLGTFGGYLFQKEGNDILVEKDRVSQKIFVSDEEGAPYISAVATTDSRVLLFAWNSAQKDLGGEFWYLDVDLSTMKAQRKPLSHRVTAALFHGDTFYYAQEGTLYTVPSAGGESKEIGAISRNSVELAVVGDVIAYYGTNGAVGACRLSGEAVTLPFVAGGSGTFRLYGTVLVGWQKCYDLAAFREVKWEELPLYVKTVSGSAFLARNGLVFSEYIYTEKAVDVKAVVDGKERVAQLPCDAPLDIVDAVFDETGIAVGTRKGKIYSALWQ